MPKSFERIFVYLGGLYNASTDEMDQSSYSRKYEDISVLLILLTLHQQNTSVQAVPAVISTETGAHFINRATCTNWVHKQKIIMLKEV